MINLLTWECEHKHWAMLLLLCAQSQLRALLICCLLYLQCFLTLNLLRCTKFLL